MKISSRDFYREMRAVLGPALKSAGFKPLKGGMAGWQRPAAGGPLCFWFWCDKWGWGPVWGSCFNLDFSLGAEPGVRTPGTRSERLGFLVEGYPDLEELRQINNGVIAGLPGTREGRLQLGRLRGGSEYVIQGFRAEPAPFKIGFDYWLNYYSIEDVRLWADYFDRKLPRLIALFENDERSELGQGRQRFNRVMGAVQALPAEERAAKIALFEDYQRAEPSAYWREAAAYWIGEIRDKAATGARA